MKNTYDEMNEILTEIFKEICDGNYDRIEIKTFYGFYQHKLYEIHKKNNLSERIIQMEGSAT